MTEPERGRRPRAVWTLVPTAGALLAVVASIALVTSRSRIAVEPPSESKASIEHEPPPSPFVAPRPTLPGAHTAPSSAVPARKAAHEVADAGAEPRGPSTASTHNAPALARLEVRVLRSGRAASGATIELLHDPLDSSLVHEATTILHHCDGDGRLQLVLAPGTARAAAWSENACALPSSARLEPATTAHIELELEPSFPVSGRVLDAASGAPIEGARVSLWTFAELDTVLSGPDGSFVHPRFPSRAPAQQIAARAEGYGTAVRYLRIDAGGGWKIPGALTGEKSQRGNGTPWVELAMVPAQVALGQVVDEDGEPVVGARVMAEGFFHAMPAVASRDFALATSDDSGRFRLTGLRSDIGHSLLIEAPGFAHEIRELEGGRTENDLGILRLTRESVLAGVAIDTNGLPLIDVEVVLRTETVEPVLASGPLDAATRLQGRERRVRTTGEGTFLFENLQPNAVRISVETTSERAEMVLEPRPDGSFVSPCLTLRPAPIALSDRVP